MQIVESICLTLMQPPAGGSLCVLLPEEILWCFPLPGVGGRGQEPRPCPQLRLLCPYGTVGKPWRCGLLCSWSTICIEEQWQIDSQVCSWWQGKQWHWGTQMSPPVPCATACPSRGVCIHSLSWLRTESHWLVTPWWGVPTKRTTSATVIFILPSSPGSLFEQDCGHWLCWEVVPTLGSGWDLWPGISALQLINGFWIQPVVQYCNYTGPDNSRLPWSENCLFILLFGFNSQLCQEICICCHKMRSRLFVPAPPEDFITIRRVSTPCISDRLEKQPFHYSKFNSFLTQLLIRWNNFA